MSSSFRALKEVCVPLLGSSLLTPQSIPQSSTLLLKLQNLLDTLPPSTVPIDYVFFPIVQIIKRNPLSTIPDVIMEKLMDILAALFGKCGWWKTCDIDIWEQMLMLCAAVFGGIDAAINASTKPRSEATRRATLDCIFAMLNPQEDSGSRLSIFIARAQSSKLLPVLRRTLTSTLDTSVSPHPALQSTSLNTISLLIGTYLPEDFIPSVLPGVVSSLVKVAVAQGGRAKGEVVSKALDALGVVIVRAVGDEICEREGAIRAVETLEEIGNVYRNQRGDEQEQEMISISIHPPPKRVPTPLRTPLFLSQTTPHLLLALRMLSHLLSHPSHTALMSLSSFADTILLSTTRTLPDVHRILLSWLLALSTHEYPEVQKISRENLVGLFRTNRVDGEDGGRKWEERRVSLQAIIGKITHDNLISLPHLIPAREERRVERCARQIAAACQLSEELVKLQQQSTSSKHVPHPFPELSKLLGPTGGIEKWGYPLLNSLTLTLPTHYVSPLPQNPIALIAAPASSTSTSTPSTLTSPIQIKGLESASAKDALEEMVRKLGEVAGDDGVWAIEWFVGVAKEIRSSGDRKGKGMAAGAMWCAGRVMEGVGRVKLEGTGAEEVKEVGKRRKRVEKVARWVGRIVAEFWEEAGWDEDEEKEERGETKMDKDNAAKMDVMEMTGSDAMLPPEYVRGVTPLFTKFDTKPTPQPSQPSQNLIPLLTTLSLHLLTLASLLLPPPLLTPLLPTLLYPPLHTLSLPAPHPLLPETATHTLVMLSTALAYAAPSNMLLANFDYALSSITRRLHLHSGRGVDIDAMSVLSVLVRVVGGGVVERAGDLVDVVGDMMGMYMGYEKVVEGGVMVWGEVVSVLEEEGGGRVGLDDGEEEESGQGEKKRGEETDYVGAFVEWYRSRKGDRIEMDVGEEITPTPRQDWSTLSSSDRGKVKDDESPMDTTTEQPTDPNADTPAPLTPTQSLTHQIITSSIPFLTHPSPVIRLKILGLLQSAIVVLSRPSPSSPSYTNPRQPKSSLTTLLPTLHTAFPYILNRLSDPVPFVVFSAVSLIETLVSIPSHGDEEMSVADFVAPKVWENVWPRFREMLSALDEGDEKSAVTRVRSGIGMTPRYAYSTSHRLYRSTLRTLRAALHTSLSPTSSMKNEVLWEVLLSVRRFLGKEVHTELQGVAREVFREVGKWDSDAAWLVLEGCIGWDGVVLGEESGEVESMRWMKEEYRWDLKDNVGTLLDGLS